MSVVRKFRKKNRKTVARNSHASEILAYITEKDTYQQMLLRALLMEGTICASGTSHWDTHCLGLFYHPHLQKRSHFSHHIMRKPTICICENKGADQLRGNREADQRLCFRYMDSTIPHLSKSKISTAARCVSDLVGTQIVGFLTQQLI